MTVEEAVAQIRREAGRLGSAVKALEKIQRAVAAPSAEEVRQMKAGSRPVSAEAHLIGVLQEALRGLENVESDLRYAARMRTLLRLEKEWRAGVRPSELEIRSIYAALETLNA